MYVDADAENGGGPEEQLLVDLRAVFHNEGDPPALATRSILHALHEMDSRPWSRYERGKPLSPQGLARVLKPFHKLGSRVGYRRLGPQRVAGRSNRPTDRRPASGDLTLTHRCTTASGPTARASTEAIGAASASAQN